MIDRSMLREHLALERRSLTEIAAGLSAIAVVGATLYNLGFFAPIEWSLISLLTVQDLLTGAVVAAVPMAAAAWAALLVGRMIQAAPSRRRLTAAIGFPVLAASTLGFIFFFDGPGQSTLGHLTCGYIALGAIGTLANIWMKSKILPAIWLAFSLLYVPTSIGIADSIASTSQARTASEVETDRGIVRGRVIRVTSAYLLIASENTVVTMPMSKVREVRRFYVRSPEADFLASALVPGPDAESAL